MKNSGFCLGKTAKCFAKVAVLTAALMMAFLLQGCGASAGSATVDIADAEVADTPLTQEVTEAPKATQAPKATVAPTVKPTEVPVPTPTATPVPTAAPVPVSYPVYSAPYTVTESTCTVTPDTVSAVEVSDAEVVAEAAAPVVSAVSADDSGISTQADEDVDDAGNCSIQIVSAESDCSTEVEVSSEGNTTTIRLTSGK